MNSAMIDDYGPQSRSDNAFTARMRFHQSWWRHHHLGERHGVDARGLEYGNYLRADAAQRGANFLTPEIAAYANDRIRSGSGVEPFRCRHNLLSSQPMAFNLFGPLHLDRDLARTLLDPLLPGGVRSAAVDVEWAPDPKTHLEDGTSFDVVIRYETSDGALAIAAIETKLTEPFSHKRYDTPLYREVAAASEAWVDPADAALADPAWNQIWRNHLLVEKIRQRPEAPSGLQGCEIVVGHPLDRRCKRSCDGYVRFLAEPARVFRSLPIDQIVSTWRPLVDPTRHGGWLDTFTTRYLDLGLSDEAWSENRRSAS